MYDLNYLLDTAKKKNDLDSDRKLALSLGHSNIAQYRTKGVIPNDQTSIKLAELCGLNPSLVIASMHAQRAETSEEKTIWKHFYKMAAAAAIAGISVSAAVSVSTENATASENMAISQGEVIVSPTMDIMSSLTSDIELAWHALCSLFIPRPSMAI